VLVLAVCVVAAVDIVVSVFIELVSWCVLATDGRVVEPCACSVVADVWVDWVGCIS
jgi:hypothetical protein